ncbi:MAG: 4Fe-4S binding protein [Planctomyces sp.]|nr:4Fe-4S binding protein [Planctomyces sp.]
MKLNWFLPFLRKKSNQTPQRSRVRAIAEPLLPQLLFSNRATKTPGLVRRTLKRMGPVWLSSPVRRTIQTFCFLLFAWLFVYVCWPYDAQPRVLSGNWVPLDVNVDELIVQLQPPDDGNVTLFDQLRSGDSVFVFTGEDDPFGEYPVVACVVVDVLADGLILKCQEADAATMEELSLSPELWSLSYQDPRAWPSHYADRLKEKEFAPAELFLMIDPLVSLSTGIASRSWVWSLTSAAVILLICVVIPRGFCGYLCPLGTLIDVFDWLVGSRVQRFRVSEDGWWVHIRFYLLAGILFAAFGGVLLSGFFAAIPVITRGLQFSIAPIQTGWGNGWHQVPPFTAGQGISLFLFAAVLMLGLLRPRFWCKYVCPSGAVLSVGNLFRISERKVESSCIHCNKCVEICPFDAIKPDFTTRTSDCTLCQSCGGVCPVEAIKFVGRWEAQNLKPVNEPPTHETSIGRRGFLSAFVGSASSVIGAAGAVAGIRADDARLSSSVLDLPVRPPGSVPEPAFLQMCIRCGECFKACPSDVLQPLGFQRGLNGLWTPYVNADWAGCASSCNACGQVCPTGAIQALPLEEKRQFRMGLAVINSETCLPIAGREACQLCVDECHSAGYHAIEFTAVHTAVDEQGQAVEGTGFLAPVLIPDKCVGCGLCQTRCFGINVAEKGLLERSAIIIHPQM